MNAALTALITLGIFVLAYFTYAKFIAHRIFALDPDAKTPAHTMTDGIDYVPTRKPVLFGHHFASITGLGPILGPAIAVIWGWLPAFLWVFLGTIFFGGVHDFSALAISMRNRGRSIGDIAESIIGPRARLLFLLIIFFLIALAMGVFAIVIATLFSEAFNPEAVVPVFSLMLIAMAVGLGVYKRGLPIGPITLIGVILMLLTTALGIKYPVTGISHDTWIYILLGYAFVASVLPVWLLLQPRDYINSFLLYIGLAAMYLGLFISQPTIAAPAINHHSTGLPPLFPFIFIMVACGAISGFHSLVSSGTTAKQINKEPDARLIGYGGAVAEGILGLMAVLACTAGLASREVWLEHYKSWGTASSLGPEINAFVQGAGKFISHLGISQTFAEAFVAVVVVGFALTTLDSATRLLRFNIEELGNSLNIKLLSNRFLAAAIAVIAIAFFALMKVEIVDPSTGAIVKKSAGLTLWGLFGTTNQILAGIVLLSVSIYLLKKGKPIVYTLVPMILMLSMTLWAMVLNLGDFWSKKKWPLLIVGTIILFMILWFIVESIIVFRKSIINSKQLSFKPEPVSK
ncbi:MAG: carbon starvation protein A [bacterium]